MRTVYKYTVQVNTVQNVSMPKGGKIVHVGTQGSFDVIEFWAIVDTNFEHEVRKFIILGTGHAVLSDYDYVGTVVMDSVAPLVWHLWEVK